MIKIGTDCSGIEAPIQAFKRLGIPYTHVFSSDIDKHVKKVSDEIYKPEIFYDDLMKRDNKCAPGVDLYVAGFPCQAFSLAGKRNGFDDIRGTVFFGCADYIRQQQPSVFIMENVKGLLSHDNGRTFQTITDLLSNCGGTVNGQISLDFFEDGLGYHIHHAVLNTKQHGIPQNRERVFIVGFKDAREFRFPVPEPLNLRLKDVLENEVDDKYYLSDKMINGFSAHAKRHKERGNGFGWKPTDASGNANCLETTEGSRPAHNYIKTHNLMPRSSKSGKGGTGHLSKEDGTAYCLDTGSNQAIEFKQLTEVRTEENKAERKKNLSKGRDYAPRRGKELVERIDGLANSLQTAPTKDQLLSNGSRIRRLTEKECFRLQDFPDSFHDEIEAIGISGTQRYKMAGNSMTVRVVEKILRRIYE